MRSPVPLVTSSEQQGSVADASLIAIYVTSLILNFNNWNNYPKTPLPNFNLGNSKKTKTLLKMLNLGSYSQ